MIPRPPHHCPAPPPSLSLSRTHAIHHTAGMLWWIDLSETAEAHCAHAFVLPEMHACLLTCHCPAAATPAPLPSLHRVHASPSRRADGQAWASGASTGPSRSLQTAASGRSGSDSGFCTHGNFAELRWGFPF